MLPQDPAMLLSVVNTKLRDQYKTLTDMCDDLDVCQDDICKKLEEIGYTYNPDSNKFI